MSSLTLRSRKHDQRLFRASDRRVSDVLDVAPGLAYPSFRGLVEVPPFAPARRQTFHQTTTAGFNLGPDEAVARQTNRTPMKEMHQRPI